MTKPTATRAERDYALALAELDGGPTPNAEYYLDGRHDTFIRAIIDYIRNNPLPSVEVDRQMDSIMLSSMRHDFEHRYTLPEQGK